MKIYTLFPLILLFLHTGCSTTKAKNNTPVPIRPPVIIEQQEVVFSRINDLALVKSSLLKSTDIFNKQFIKIIGAHLVKHTLGEDVAKQYKFHVSSHKSNITGHFHHKHIVVSKNLITLLKYEDELAAIVAHELSHLMLKHKFKHFLEDDKNRKIEQKRSEYVSTLIQENLNHNYNSQEELEAGVLAIKILIQADYDPRAYINIIEKQEQKIFRKRYPLSLDTPVVNYLKAVVNNSIFRSNMLRRSSKFYTYKMQLKLK